MWTLPSAARALSAFVAASTVLWVAGSAQAQTTSTGGQFPYNYTNQTYSYGLYLPQVPQPNGQDEIRAADGTTCRSSMASNDAYLDVGGIGGQGSDGQFNSGTVYGRIIVPLGGVPQRLDCSSLYNLEIARLQNELELVRAGLGGGSGIASAAGAGGPGRSGKAWAEQGWSDHSAALNGAGPAKKATGGNFAPSRAKSNDGVVPARLGGPLPAVPTAPPVVPTSTATDVEILPWSNIPAEGARVLTMMPPRRVEAEVTRDDETPGRLSHPSAWGG